MRILKRLHVRKFLIGVLAGVAAVAAWLTWEWQIYKERTFIRHVLLLSEYGDRVDRVARWTHSPRVTFASKTKVDYRFSREIVAELNGVLDSTGYRLITDFSDDLKPHIYVLVTERKEFGELDGTMGCELTIDALGQGCIRAGENWSYEKAIVLVSAEEPPLERKSILLEELFQSLGPGNDSPIYPDSVAYETDYHSPAIKTLSARDKKLLRFLYLYLKPGDGDLEVRRAFKEHWDEIRVK